MPVVAPARWALQSVAKVPLNELADFGDELAADKELGASSAETKVYARGNVQVTAIFTEAPDPSSAYALYTLYKQPNMRPVPGVELAVENSRFALITRGRYFIRVVRSAPLRGQDLKSLLVDIGGARLSPENAESLPPHLPSRGLVPGTERYVLGPTAMKLALPSLPPSLVGFNVGAEVTSGTYLSEGDKLVLVMVSYPTPQIAGLQFKILSQRLGINSTNGANGNRIYGRQQGSYALLVLGAPRAAPAYHLLDQFRVHQIVTQVPAFPRHDKFALQLVELVIANGELIMVIIVFAILGGVLMYLAKRLIMKLFPNSSWIPADEDVLIKLKLSWSSAKAYTRSSVPATGASRDDSLPRDAAL